MRVLTWNLYHGRAVPGAGRGLLDEFSALLAAWEWDVALLQEVPPWWPRALAQASGAGFARALTSRNFGLPVRRAVAERWPDIIRSNGGGADAILVRGEGALEHRVARVRYCPERRVVHAVRLASGVWAANLHASVHARAPEDGRRARARVLEWAGSAPVVLGGDFNTRHPPLPGFVRAASHRIDGIWARGLEPAAAGEVLDSGRLSDHAPVRARLSSPGRGAGRSPAP